MLNWFITGVGTGLGRALARAALARGDKVFGSVRTNANARAFEATAPGRAISVHVDVCDTSALTGHINRIEASGTALDVLVNNAGYGLTGAVEETSLDEARLLFETNVFGALAAIQAVLPFMRRRHGGRIVNITSVSGLATWAGTGVYSATKFALEAIGATLADEVAEFGIRVTNVAPGGLRTDFASRSLKRAAHVIGDYDAVAHAAGRILADHAGREPGDPDLAASAILHIVDHPEPPMHLLLGADAMQYAAAKRAALQTDIDAWASVTHSIAHDE